MPNLSSKKLENYRAQTFRLRARHRLQSVDDALQFVNERGFVFLWPIKNIVLPNLWNAVAGDRAVAEAHDDPGHITWRWKDEMLNKRKWYYAKLLRNKATVISLDTSKYFYALKANFGDPEQDYLQLYEDGLLSQAGKSIFETLLREGPLDTVKLKRLTHMASRSGTSAFNRGLTELQKDFKILPMGVAEAGAWRYSFVFDAVHRYYPKLPQQARAITRDEARQELTRTYINSVGAATAGDVKKLFGWKLREAQAALQQLKETGEVQIQSSAGASREQYFVLDTLIT